MFNSYVQLPDPGWYLIVPSRNQNYPSWWMKTSLANAAALDPRLSPLFEWRIAYPAIPIRLSSMIPVRSSQLKQNWSPIWIFSMLSMLVFVQRARCFNTGSGPWQFGALAVPVLRIPHGMGSLPTQKCGWENHGWDPWFSPEFDPTSSTKPPKWMWHVKTKKKNRWFPTCFPPSTRPSPKKPWDHLNDESRESREACPCVSRWNGEYWNMENYIWVDAVYKPSKSFNSKTSQNMSWESKLSSRRRDVTSWTLAAGQTKIYRPVIKHGWKTPHFLQWFL